MNKIKQQNNFQMLGFLGIFKESFKLIFTHPLIFLQITLTSILPVSCLTLVSIWFSTPHNLSAFQQNQLSSPRYNTILSSTISKELHVYWVIQAAFLIFSSICSLISVSTIIYTISCIYTNQEITFNKVIKVVPKVWKPYMITYLSRFCITILVYIPLLIWLIITFVMVSQKWRMICILIGVLCFLVTICCLGIIWQLSNAIPVMEKICGFEALKKSRALIKGKTGTALAIFFAAMLSSTPISLVMLNKMQVFVGDGAGVSAAICYRILCVIWLSFVSLFFVVTQGVFYFVCKSYHQEDIDEYLGEYVSLKGQNVRVEQAKFSTV